MISAKPRLAAPFRFKQRTDFPAHFPANAPSQSSSRFAQSIVMALSKADPAQLASIAGGGGDGATQGPLLYLDTASEYN